MIKFTGELPWFISRSFINVLILLFFCILACFALIFPNSLWSSYNTLEINNVVTQDIQAPRSLSYESEILSVQTKNDAENNVAAVYFPVDPSITRQQIERLQVILNYITSVRLDTYASNEQKFNDILLLKDIHLQKNIVDSVLNLNDSRWQIVQQEALSVLEQIERNTIREDQLNNDKQQVQTIISYSLPQEEAMIVAALVTPLIVPNSLYSPELTETAKREARDSVQPILRNYVIGETIVERGEVITPLIWEALDEFGLIRKPSISVTIISSSSLVLTICTFIVLYYRHRKVKSPLNSIPASTLITITLLTFLYTARLVMPNRTIIPYVFPLSAFGLAVAGLFSTEIGMLSSIILSVLSVYGLSRGLDLNLYFIFSSLIGILALNRGRRIASFFWAGLAIGISGSLIILAFRLPDGVTDWVGILTLIAASIFNGFASSSLSFIIRFIFSQILGEVTPFQLLEISRPDHPLLQHILRNASGTYQHSLQVANLAEHAAEAIGADALLTRVGALFHDAGKANNPSFFIENKLPGAPNPHDDLDPTTSATIIIQHVTDGIQLARKYRVPERIQDFIREHHGTLVTTYQYSKAVNAAGDQPEFVNLDPFRYPGPRPRSRETALLMLADQCEARARADLPVDEKQLHTIIKEQFEYCRREGQLDKTPLTLNDLNIALESFVYTLKTTHHLRIKYPQIKPPIIQQNVSQLKSGIPLASITIPLKKKTSNKKFLK